MQKGVTLLLAVLISSIALSVGVGIFSLLFSQIKLSGTAQDSVIAFYAADSGAECALYWDLRDLLNSPFGEGSNPIECAGKALLVGGSAPCAATPCVSDFFLEFEGTQESCTRVTITKRHDEDGILVTHIASAGENRDRCDIVPTSLRTVQRGYEFDK